MNLRILGQSCELYLSGSGSRFGYYRTAAAERVARLRVGSRRPSGGAGCRPKKAISFVAVGGSVDQQQPRRRTGHGQAAGCQRALGVGKWLQRLGQRQAQHAWDEGALSFSLCRACLYGESLQGQPRAVTNDSAPSSISMPLPAPNSTTVSGWPATGWKSWRRSMFPMIEACCVRCRTFACSLPSACARPSLSRRTPLNMRIEWRTYGEHNGIRPPPGY